MVRRNRASRRKRAGVKAGRTYKNLVGTRAEVWHKTAFKTGYGKTKSEGGTALTRVNLVKNKHGRIVSKSKAAQKNKIIESHLNKNNQNVIGDRIGLFCLCVILFGETIVNGTAWDAQNMRRNMDAHHSSFHGVPVSRNM